MKKQLLFLLLLLSFLLTFSIQTHAQQNNLEVEGSINATGAVITQEVITETVCVGQGLINPDLSAIFELQSTEKGILIPRMTSAERDAIASPATSLLIYQTNNSPGFYYHNGTIWVAIEGADSDPTNELELPTAPNTGEMTFWDGSQWTSLQVGAPGQVLGMVDGVPAWTSDEVPNVTSTTGEIWMDRNLGAAQIATSSTDSDSYGYYYQWGRGTDGHQISTSNTTTTLSSTNQPGHGDFIQTDTWTEDWHIGGPTDLWKEDGTGENNPCPSGYRVPTSVEWDTERLEWSSNNEVGAFNSPLKLTMTGVRAHNSATVDASGVRGTYWSSNVYLAFPGTAYHLDIYTNNIAVGNGDRAHGMSIRCIKDDNTPTTPNQIVSTDAGNLATAGTDGGVLITSVDDADADPMNEIELPTGGTSGQVLSTNGSGVYTWVAPDSGPAGADGAQGPAGADGADGATGAQGPIGLTGPAGADGTNGADGVQGPIGLTGPAGADGATGPAGADGQGGVTAGGTNITLTGAGTTGDPYIVNANIDDADANATNEIQDLSLSGNTLSLTNDASTVDLSGYLELPQSPNPGDMSYWDGTAWVSIPVGADEQTLRLCSGVPTWGPCPTCIDGIQNGNETGVDCGGSCLPCPTNTNPVIPCLTTPTEVVEITNPITGRVWMDRNLGAHRAALSFTDEYAYGDLYQWGRGNDGHQCRTSNTTNVLSSGAQPGHPNFITTSSSPHNWLSPPLEDLWAGVTAINNPCPPLFRVPTAQEMEEERNTWIQQGGANATGAYASLKLSKAGKRREYGTVLYNLGRGNYAFSTGGVNEEVGLLYVTTTHQAIDGSLRSLGVSVRCIKD